MKTLLFYLVTSLGVLWIQALLQQGLGSWGMSLPIALVVTLYFGFSRGPLVGTVVGFAWGLLMDAASMGSLGAQALLFATCGYLSGNLSRQLDASKIWTQVAFSFLMSVGYLILYDGLDRILLHETRAFSWGLLSQPFANALVAPVIFWVFERWSDLWEMG